MKYLVFLEHFSERRLQKNLELGVKYGCFYPYFHKSEPEMLANYFPILVFVLVGLFAGVLFITLGLILGPNRPGKVKQDPFECGFEAFENARMRFDVRYYLVAILFILFDLEVAFMVPWAVVFKELGAYGFWSMLVFLVILVIGFVYEWKKGALEWE